MSVHREYTQRLTNQFQAGPFDATGAWSTYLWTDSELQANLISFAPTTKSVNGSMVTYNTEVDLIAGLNQIWIGGTPAEPREFLIDMGKEYNLGLKGGDSKIVTMRRVQRTNGTASSGGVGGTSPAYNSYWTPVLNKLSASPQLNTVPDFPILPVTVSRV